jgi:prevent-host-death family protein
MTLIVNIHQAKTHLSKLLERVANGEEIIIAKAGKPVAVLSPIHTSHACRVPGNDAGLVILTPAFEEPLPEFEV